MKKPFWEKTYLNSNETFEGGKPADELVELHKQLPYNASVLDIGCGDGRNSIYLAGKGFNITAIDISENGLRKLRQTTKEKGLKIETENINAAEYCFEKKFDLIIAYGVLHLIKKEERKILLKRIKDNTRKNGFNVILVFTDTLPAPPDLAPFMIGLFEEGEIFNEYSDWEMIENKSYILNDVHPGGIKHKHPINKITCKKTCI
ncbi:MAG TPA: methyltransferase domain-containing protein [Ignavibacteriaceae bacterium]|nr:methyltransferase domain-containing protein [Ignavibacteriaceae bacterium]